MITYLIILVIAILFVLSIAYYIALKLFQGINKKEKLHYFSLDFSPKEE